MNEITYQRCIKAMEKIYSHPLYELFLDPVDPERDEAPGYFEKIKNPMDFTTISKKLKNNLYNNVNEWKEDLNLIISNSLEYNTKKSSYGIATPEMNKIIKDSLKTIVDDPAQIWYNDLVEIKKEIRSLVNKKVSNVLNDSEILLKSNSKDLDISPEIHRFLVQSMSNNELLLLKNALFKLNKPEQKKQIYFIISQLSPEIIKNNNNLIDLNLLSPNVLVELKEFAFSQNVF